MHHIFKQRPPEESDHLLVRNTEIQRGDTVIFQWIQEVKESGGMQSSKPMEFPAQIKNVYVGPGLMKGWAIIEW